MNILNHKLGLIVPAFIVALATGCGTTAVHTAQSPVASVAHEVIEVPAAPNDQTSWVRFRVAPNAPRSEHPVASTSLERNTLCAGAVQPMGTACHQAPRFDFVAAR